VSLFVINPLPHCAQHARMAAEWYVEKTAGRAPLAVWVCTNDIHNGTVVACKFTWNR